jgi:flagellar biosynthesis protein FlhF
MKLKSYFSGSVEAAVGLARKELGEDALLVNARPTTPETRHLGAYEVVFGQNAQSPLATGVSGSTPSAASPAAARDVSQDISEMRREIERLARCLGGPRTSSAPQGDPLAGSIDEYLAKELDPIIARAVASGASLEEFFEVDATLGRPGLERAVVALVGPPGVGKTTTLVKLAARFGLVSRRPPHIITSDVFRIAATEQLRSLAAILGVGYGVVETPVALAQSLEEHRTKDLVFIDTPGLGRSEMEDGADLARLIATHPEIDTHLVLSAAMKPEDLTRVIERYGVFQPKKLLFTRLDETERFGAIVSEASRSGLPVSFLANGQMIPDDLEPATKPRLAEMVLGRGASLKATA